MVPADSSIYPSHFTEELKQHCRRSGIPPAVYDDLASAVKDGAADDEERRHDLDRLSYPFLFPFMVFHSPSDATLSPLSEPKQEASPQERDAESEAVHPSPSFPFPSRLAARQGCVLARYIRIHTSSLSTMLQLGAVFISRWITLRRTSRTLLPAVAAGETQEEEERNQRLFVSPDALPHKEAADTCPRRTPSVKADVLALCALSSSFSRKNMSRDERWRIEYEEARRIVKRWRRRPSVMPGRAGGSRSSTSWHPHPSPSFPASHLPPSSQPSMGHQEEGQGMHEEASTPAALFERMVYDGIEKALEEDPRVPPPTHTPSPATVVPTCGSLSDSHPLLPMLPTRVLERLPPLLVLWFAVSYLLQLPLLFVSPVRWTSPSWLSSGSAASLLAAMASSSSDRTSIAYILYAFSPLFPAKVRGEAEFPADFLSFFSSSSASSVVPPSPAFQVPLSYFFTPMDAASVAAVMALNPHPRERLLDLCCSPGMKLQTAAEVVHGLPFLPDNGGGGSSVPLESEAERQADVASEEPSPSSCANGLVVGVDVDLPRLFVTRSLLHQRQSPLSIGELEGGGGGGEKKKKKPAYAWVTECFRRLFPSPPAFPVALFTGNGVTFSMSKAVAFLQSATGVPPPLASWKVSHPAASVSASPWRTVMVCPRTGVTAHEARRLQKRRLARLPTVPSTTTGTASPAMPRHGDGPQAVNEGVGSPILPVYVPWRTRDTILRALAVPQNPTLPPPTEKRDPTTIPRKASIVHSSACSPGPTHAAAPLSPAFSPFLFDGVLVDVECTHDGSLAHVQVVPTTHPMSSSSSATPGGASSAFLSCTNPHRRARPHPLPGVPPPRTSKTSDVEAHLEGSHPSDDATLDRGGGGGGDPTERRGGTTTRDTTATAAFQESSCAAPCVASPLWTDCPRWFWGPVFSPSHRRFFTWLREDALLQLQLALLFNAFQQLRVGGRLVYSTCTMAYLQNEYVICCFLRLMNTVETDMVDHPTTALAGRNSDEQAKREEAKASIKVAPSALDPPRPPYMAQILPPFPPDFWEERVPRARGEAPAPSHEKRKNTARSSERCITPSSPSISFHATTPVVEVLLRIVTVLQESLLSSTPVSSPFPSSEEGMASAGTLDDPHTKWGEGEAVSTTPHTSFVRSRLDSYDDFLDALDSSYDAYAILRHGKERLQALSSDDCGETTGVSSSPPPLPTFSTKGSDAPVVDRTPFSKRTRRESSQSGASDANMSHPRGTAEDGEEVIDGGSPCKGPYPSTMGMTNAVQETHMGERLWPLVLNTSFQYITKIKKVEREIK